MNVSICTISFRHSLQSIEQLAHWSAEHGFDGIELCGAHARNLHSSPELNGQWLQSYGLSVPLISDYLPLHQEWESIFPPLKSLITLAERWQTNKLRIFAGDLGSQQISSDQRNHLVKQLRRACHYAAEHGRQILVEIHPRTLCDSIPSTLQLFGEVNHPALKINFDVLHTWESGANINRAFTELRPFIEHLHLKNVHNRSDLDVFLPERVFQASASRKGMTSLFHGVIDYDAFLSEHDLTGLNASLEWFGAHPFEVLQEDNRKLRAYRKEKLYH
ncbi:3-dehydroshikimate dehydratase [Alkalihalobacillus xiaoxiensis]|uniref:3-dehydroshikimate dehydratase n=1 Tax=Shouchella xiaoxiensis TaxID=766895 RepID=A0ABS2SZ01_9BACI|nr:sugar phosphate isomerase/epimerase [Shouchella xiaoxiensis]MBM7840719.1 3-dehydroshikimate dehydratase [Shouchella xiaoxiensis]